MRYSRRLTDEERKIFDVLSTHTKYTNKEIAHQINMTEYHVGVRLQSIYVKLGLAGKAELIRLIENINAEITRLKAENFELRRKLAKCQNEVA